MNDQEKITKLKTDVENLKRAVEGIARTLLVQHNINGVQEKINDVLMTKKAPIHGLN